MKVFDSVQRYNEFNQHDTLHPLVSILDFSKADMRSGPHMQFGIYCIILKEIECGNLIYGRQKYDYQEGTLIFVSPGQIVDVSANTTPYQPLGHGIVFHSDLLIGTSLFSQMDQYKFFKYEFNEALHLSKKEREQILSCLSNITEEISRPIDQHSRKLIVANIELFLNYCQRFYDRQFITRKHINKNIVDKFEEALNQYFKQGKALNDGLPTVSMMAHELHLSPNYFGDLIKKETEISAQEYIKQKVITIAKDRMFDATKNISDISHELGFKYPQHFSRTFKKEVGMTPYKWRTSTDHLGSSSN